MKDIEKETYMRAIEVARALVQEETELWRENTGAEDGEYSAPALAMELQLFAMTLDDGFAVEGGIKVVEHFCELSGLDFLTVEAIIDDAISYGLEVVEAEDSGGL